MGVRQQAPGKPAALGPSLINSDNFLRWVLVSLGGLPDL